MPTCWPKIAFFPSFIAKMAPIKVHPKMCQKCLFWLSFISPQKPKSVVFFLSYNQTCGHSTGLTAYIYIYTVYIYLFIHLSCLPPWCLVQWIATYSDSSKWFFDTIPAKTIKYIPLQQGKLPTELTPLENYLEIGNGLPNRKKLFRGIIWAGNGD